MPWTKKSLKVQILKFLGAPMKFSKFFMLFMKPKHIFTSKLVSIFSIMTPNSSVLFYLKNYIGAH